MYKIEDILNMEIYVKVSGSVFGAPTTPGTVAPLGYTDTFEFKGLLKDLPKALYKWKYSGELTYYPPNAPPEKKRRRYIVHGKTKLTTLIDLALRKK